MPYGTQRDALKRDGIKFAKQLGATIAFPGNEMELTFNSVEDAERFLREALLPHALKTALEDTDPTPQAPITVHTNGGPKHGPEQSCGAEIPHVMDGNFCGFMERAAKERKASCSACGLPVPQVLKDRYSGKRGVVVPLRPTRFVSPAVGSPKPETVEVYGPHVNVNAQRRVYARMAKEYGKTAKQLDVKLHKKTTTARAVPQLLNQRNLFRGWSQRYTEAARLCGKAQLEHMEGRKMKKARTTTAKKTAAPKPKGNWKPAAKITILDKTLGCVKGTAKHKLRSKILTAKTVEAALGKGLRPLNLRNMVADGTIKIA